MEEYFQLIKEGWETNTRLRRMMSAISLDRYGTYLFGKYIERDELQEAVIEILLAELEKRLSNKPYEIITMELVIEPDEEYETTFRGELFSGIVPGFCGFVGEFKLSNGDVIKLFPKFVTHPFWQCGKLTV